MFIRLFVFFPDFKCLLEAQIDSCQYLGNYSGAAFSPKCICIVFLLREWADEYTCPASHSFHLLPALVLPS